MIVRDFSEAEGDRGLLGIEPEMEDGGVGMVDDLFEIEAADRAGLMAVANDLDGSEKQAIRKRAVIGIDRRRNMKEIEMRSNDWIMLLRLQNSFNINIGRGQNENKCSFVI